MKIILDTNILMSDWLHRSIAFKIFIKGIKDIPAKIVIPQVVLDELFRNYSRSIDELISDMDQCNKKLEKLAEVSLKKVEKEVLENRYRLFIRKFLNDNDIKILEYPKIEIKEAIRRELNGAKPFKSSGEGYRDYVIWETIKREIDNYEQEDIIFISLNRKDFGNPPDLDEELKNEIKYKPANLFYFKSISEFNKKYILPRQEEIKILTENVNSLFKNEFDIFMWIKNHAKDIIYDNEVGRIIFDTGDYSRIHPLAINRIDSIEIMEVVKLDDDEYSLELVIKVDVVFSIDISWDDYQNSNKVKEFVGEVDEPFSYIWWNQKSKVELDYLLIVSTEGEIIEEELKDCSTYY